MSVLSQRLSDRAAQYSQVPVQQARQSLALSQTYYNGPTMHAAGTAITSASDRTAAIGQRRAANNATVSSIIGSRQQAKSVQDALATAQAREAAANKQIADAKDSFDITTPTTPSIAIGVAQRYGQDTKASKTTVGRVTTGGKPNKAQKITTPKQAGRAGAAAAGFAGTSTGVRITGPGNNSGSPGALGGSGHSGQYSYAYNTSLGSGRNKVLKEAVSYLGTRYVLGGSSHTGIDCSGLVQNVYRQMGFAVPTHSAADQGQTGGRNNGNGIPGVRTSISNLRPGDLVAWKDGSHIAIYAGGGKIIEAANPQRGTVYRTLWASQSAVIGIRVTLPGDGNVGQSKAQTAAKSKTLASKASRFG